MTVLPNHNRKIERTVTVKAIRYPLNFGVHLTDIVDFRRFLCARFYGLLSDVSEQKILKRFVLSHAVRCSLKTLFHKIGYNRLKLFSPLLHERYERLNKCSANGPSAFFKVIINQIAKFGEQTGHQDFAFSYGQTIRVIDTVGTGIRTAIRLLFIHLFVITIVRRMGERHYCSSE